jgi:uncharacterized sodium:solute symporter family permease YidK
MGVPKAPGAAGVASLIGGPIVYGLFQNYAGGLHFLIQVALTFAIVVAIMALITWLKPLDKPRVLPVREDLDTRTAPEVRIAAFIVLAAVAVFYVIFW